MEQEGRPHDGFCFLKISIFAVAQKSIFLVTHIVSDHLGIFSPALPGAARCALASYYMTRRAALPKSNTVTGVICAVRR